MKTLGCIATLMLVVGSPLAIGSGVARAQDAGAPAGRYQYTATSTTAYDTKTKLTWQRAAAAGTMTWANAKTYCAGQGPSTLGGTGWRLPTLKELLTLVNLSLPSSVSVATIDSAAFPETIATLFWTATARAGSTTQAWYVGFNSGSFGPNVTTASYAVRCVR
jgi:Protein of unknown function (DUF1566)